jgi:solute carrier family 25 phosphate transporter 23/24/25/41
MDTRHLSSAGEEESPRPFFLQLLDRHANDTTKLLFCGGFAGAVSKTATAPLARLTILYQVGGISSIYPYQYDQHARRPSVLRGLQHVVRNEGLRSLWKGNGVTIVHRIPYSATNFWTYEKVNELWKERLGKRNDVSRRLVSGGTAGMVACTIAYPLDLIRTRLAAQSETILYDGITDAVRKITQEEGFFGLYRGLGATLLQVTPSLGINYAAYETARSKYMSYMNQAEPTVAMSLVCGSAAGLVSSTTTFPLDLVRRRLQLQGNTRSSKMYGSYLGAFKDIYLTEGWRGLYSGILPEYYKVIPGVAIAFCAYEVMKGTLKVETNATDR